MRCLVVDDSPDDRSLVERMLSRCGHRAKAVSSGMEALAALGDARFDVALVDLDMPGMSGAETIAALRNLDQGMRIMVVSGRDDRKHVLEAIGAGADGYLLKDELGDGLATALQAVAAGKSPLSPAVGAVLVRQSRRATAPTGPVLALRLPATDSDLPVPPPPAEANVKSAPRERPKPPQDRKLADASGELRIDGVDLKKPDQ